MENWSNTVRIGEQLITSDGVSLPTLIYSCSSKVSILTVIILANYSLYGK